MRSTKRTRTHVAILAGLLSVVLAVSQSTEANADTSACLLKSQYEPCLLLEESLVRGALGDSAVPQLDQKSYSTTPRAPRMGRMHMPPSNISSCTYSWPSSMKRSIKMPANKTMEVPRDAEVRLTGIVEYPETPLVTFERTHRTPTAEELAMLNEQVDKGMAKAKSEGKINDAGQNLGKDLAKQATEGIRYSEVSDVGDAARWESKFSQLSVLVGAVKFDVYVSVSVDANKNEQIATTIAAGLLQACR